MIKLSISLLIIMLSISSFAIAQLDGFEFRKLSRDSLLTIAREIIKTDRTCTFITVDEEGKPRARILAFFPPEDDWTILLGTSTNSRKVKQVMNNSNTMVFFYDPKGRSYVSIAGKTSLVNDPELKKKYWKEGWKVYYPNPDTDYILMEVVPERMEICSYEHKLFWDSSGKPSFVEFKLD